MRVEVGDLVIRNVENEHHFRRGDAEKQRSRLGHGIVLTKQLGGIPEHPRISVYYPKAGKIGEIAESLMVVISGRR